jgi:TPM domain
MILPQPAVARLESVNRPDLLPSEKGLNVIQTEKFLTTGQAKRMNDMLANLEKDTGFRVKVLCQNYPNTPGLAIRDYWSLGKEEQKDDKYVVLVVDQFGGRGNSLNFNVGDVRS